MKVPPLVVALLVVALAATTVVLVTDVPVLLKVLVTAASLGFAALVAVTSRRQQRQGR
jgi:hypothetical protein